MVAQIGDSFSLLDISSRIDIDPNTAEEYSGNFVHYDSLYTGIVEGLAAGNTKPAGASAVTGLFFFDDILYAAYDTGSSSRLYKTTTNEEITTNPSWEIVDMGLSAGFKDATRGFTTYYDRKFLEDSVSTPDPITDLLPGELYSTTVIGQTDSPSNPFPRSSWFPLDNPMDGTDAVPVSYTSSGLLWNPTPVLNLRGIINPDDIPEKVNIVGIKVDVRFRYNLATSSGGTSPNLRAKMKLATLNGVGTTTNKAPVTEVTGNNSVSTTFATTTIGGSSDTWGATKLTRSNLISDDFGVNLQWELYSGTLSSSVPIRNTVEVAWVKVSIYFENSSETVYFWNGASDVASGDVVNVSLTEGSYVSENAAGYVTLYNTTGAEGVDLTGTQIRTEAAGGGEVIGTGTGVLTANRLPSSAELKAANALMVTREINFFIDPEKNALYGATAAGPAFHFNGTHFWFIRTPVPDDKDKPRYIYDNQLSLVLAYDSGSILISPPGKPSTFSGLLGATEFGFFGKPITGLMKIGGTALGIWTDSSIEALVGNTVNNYTTQTIAENTGAINYTVVDAGQPLFVDYRGISNVQASQTYGDFSWGRVSYTISPYLQGKVQERNNPFNMEEGIVCAIPVKNKGQYRLYFKDGHILTMTLFGPDGSTPMFTKQNFGSEVKPLRFVPSAYATAISKNGREIIAIGNSEGDIFILDTGNPSLALSSGLESFNYNLTFNPLNAGAPFANLKVAEVMVHISSSGFEEFQAQAGVNYLSPDINEWKDSLVVGSDENTIDWSLPHTRVSAHLPNITDGFVFKLQGSTDTKPYHMIKALTYKVVGLTDMNRSPKTY